MGRVGYWLAGAGGLACLVVAVLGLRAWRQNQDYQSARAELAAGQAAVATQRLEALDRSRPLWVWDEPGAFEYQLGLGRWRVGRPADALAALRRVPETSTRATETAALSGQILLDEGRWREAEETLERALASGRGDRTAVRAGLVQVYRLQARFEDAAAVLRESWQDSPEPVHVLRDLWRNERGTPPFATISEALDTCARLNPAETRVWLGRARVATQTGRLEEANTWLSRCEAPEARPDAAVARARLEWARTADRPDAAAAALRSLGPEHLPAVDWIEWRAWFYQRLAKADDERRALRILLSLQPRNPRWLNRAAALAAEAGDARSAAGYRATKAEVDDALDAYTLAMASEGKVASAAERTQMARLAAAAGRTADAEAWYTLALRADPDAKEARSEFDRLRASLTRLVTDRPADRDPWAGPLPSLTAARPAARAVPTFEDAARSAALVHVFRNGETPIRQMPVALSGGVGLIDYDGDGLLDVYALQGGPFPPPATGTAPASGGDRLFRNRGDGTFEDVTEPSGIAAMTRGYGHGVAVGDVDNDGRPDLLVTRWRSYALYHNEGGGRFRDATAAWGLGGDRDWPTSAAFADLDGDGDLDLYVCHYLEWNETEPKLCRDPKSGRFFSCNPKDSPSRPDHLFRNDGGKFTDVSEEAGVTAADRDGRGLGVVAADLDDDGRIDLFVANDKSANFLFRNLGGFKFEEVAHDAGVAGNSEGGYQAGMGVACGDLDGDGRLDVVVTNYYGESTSVFRNHGGGVFTDRTAASGIGLASRLRLGFGIDVLDADNDGNLDLLTANGHTDDLGDVPYRMPAQFLRGDGRGRFTDVTASAGPPLSVARVGRGLAVGDLDGDGRQDALLVGQNDPVAYLRNTTERAGHWVAFELEGKVSNRDGVGSVVTVEAGGRKWTRHRVGGGSYLSAGDPGVHFGLGDARVVTRVEVRWPSGKIDRLADLPADARYHLREGDAAAKPATARPGRRGDDAPGK